MPDFPIIDAHVHLWNPDRFRMSWLDGVDLLNQPYEYSHFSQHSSALSLEAFVYVEVGADSAYSFLEAQWVAGVARQEARLKGIVAAAPLEYGNRLRYYLEALVALGPQIKGVRRLLQDETNPNFCLQPDFVEGVRLLPEYGLSFDLCIKHYQLPGVIELVKSCPQTSFILDHIAKPDIRNKLTNPWQQHIRELAALPNVVCKISGLVTEADHQNWTADNLLPYVNTVLEAFGEERVLFGSDWPVALLASSYTRWVETLDKLTAELNPEARRKLWAENTHRIYRL